MLLMSNAEKPCRLRLRLFASEAAVGPWHAAQTNTYQHTQRMASPKTKDQIIDLMKAWSSLLHKSSCARKALTAGQQH